MKATKAPEQQQQASGSQNEKLDHRYGKIGISAVAAAVNNKTAKAPAQPSRYIPADSD